MENSTYKKVTSNNNTAEYVYDNRGHKLKTIFYAANINSYKYAWYVNDASGKVLSIYEYDGTSGNPAFTLVAQSIYGAGRIGTLNKVNGIIDYELSDHLGNVRATIKKISTGVYELTSRTDYYAFGGIMPGRSYNSNSYRFNFQGQENAVSSNWQQFELRMHNSNLGRWMSPDPYGQFSSPYISMGNNPINGVDPDGGYWANVGKSTQNTTRSATSLSDSQTVDGTITYGSCWDLGYNTPFEMYQALGGSAGILGAMYGKGGGGSVFGSWGDDGSNGWKNPNWATDLITTYIVTDIKGGEHMSFTKTGADKLKSEYDFFYDQMVRSDGKDMGAMLWKDALKLNTDANTYYIGNGLSVKDVSNIHVEHGKGKNWATAALAFMAADAVVPEPSDLAWPKWAGYAVVGAAAGTYLYAGDYVKKMDNEISRLVHKATGPQGFQYALVAKTNGFYPNVRGGTTFLSAGDVWKYGETTNMKRYSRNYLTGLGLKIEAQFFGNQMEIKVQEKIMIYWYFATHGSLPPGNRIFR